MSSTFSLDNGQPTLNYVLCQLVGGGTVVDYQDVGLGPNEQAGERIAVSLEGGHTLAAAGLAEVQCRSGNGPGVILNASVTALQVATLTNA